MHREPRSSTGEYQVVHINVGPEVEDGAHSLLVNVLMKNGPDGGGYHWLIDNAHELRIANDNELVYAAKGCGGAANRVGLHYCLIGNCQTTAQWDDAYSNGELTILAKRIAADAVAKGFPIEHVRAVLRGQIGHHDVTLACNVFGGHTDPGCSGETFPWAKFMDLVRWYAQAPAPVVPSGGSIVGLRVADHTNTAPGARERQARWVPGHGIALENGARSSGETGPTAFGNWVLVNDDAKANGEELVAVPGGFYLAFGKGRTDTHGPWFFHA